jgi:endonuclease/exonuclease/phosphatase family metal-dependent hydrolase
VAASLLLLALSLGAPARDGWPSLLAGGLGLAVLASIVLRALGSGLDASTAWTGQLIGWPLGIAAIWWWPSAAEREPPAGATCSALSAAVIGAGMMAVLTLLYFGFVAPNVIAAWTGTGYLMVTAVIALGALIWCALLYWERYRSWLTPWRLRAGTMLFTALLVLTVVPHHVGFPSSPDAYPVAAPHAPTWATPVLVLTLLLSPIVVLDFLAMAGQFGALSPSVGRAGLALGAGAVCLGAMVIAQIFTTTYDYVPVIGPAFRDRFWAVVAAPAVLLVAAQFAVPATRSPPARPNGFLAAGLVSLAALAIGSAAVLKADPGPAPVREALTVVTYNVRQGYNQENRPSIDQQLEVLRSLDADVIGLQESDTNRVANGNNDLVRFLANELELHAYHGAKTVTGTFGIALLSRYPIEDARTFYLFSEGEQTAVIQARLTVAGRTFDVLVTHLGNGGPVIQLEQVLEIAEPLPDVVLVGDFNFRPRQPQYELTTARLDDAWAKRWPVGTDAGGSTRAERIDYVFVTPGTNVLDATYVDVAASDHPALVVTLSW